MAETSEQPQHGPSSMSEEVEGYIQGVRHNLPAALVLVPYWSLVNWQQEAERLQQALTAQAPLVAAVARYGRAKLAQDQFPLSSWGGQYLDPRMITPEHRAADRECYEAQRELDVLIMALARATPDAGGQG